jgi:hypothetical protein
MFVRDSLRSAQPLQRGGGGIFGGGIYIDMRA